jgi:hypothetical protein
MSDLQHKTIRPGSLNGYSYYSSAPRRRPGQPAAPARKRPAVSLGRQIKLVLLLFVAIFLFGFAKGGFKLIQPAADEQNVPAISATTETPGNPCANNNLNKLIKVSVSQRHLWVCQGSKVAHHNAVITGMTQQPDTLTPLGTYHIYAKLTNTTLKGHDSTGSWSDPVYYNTALTAFTTPPGAPATRSAKPTPTPKTPRTAVLSCR